MKRRDFIKSSLVAGVGFNGYSMACASEGKAEITGRKEPVINQAKVTRQPHIVFIMSDQHRGDVLRCMGNEAVISPNIDLEHATCYSPDNYWCALTDGKIKYIWFMHSGEEQLFDLLTDPGKKKDLAKMPRYRKQLSEMREEMVRHLNERGDGFVKNGQLVKREKTLIYSPNYPKEVSN